MNIVRSRSGAGRQEMQVLPDRAADGARNPDVVLEAGQAARERLPG